MSNSTRDLELLLTLGAFRALFNTNSIKIKELNAAISVLIQAGIPFDVSFIPSAGRVVPTVTLTIFINPTTTITFSFLFEASTFGTGKVPTGPIL